ncbi:MAG: peptidoglycan -binding protein [Gammaproteobacteria bacterium]|nr:peptidoglycan -binding protein [Gammaproteobacteria bacterium]
MFALTRRSRYAVNVWPAFVDALASVLLVFIFVVLIFVLAQFFLNERLIGRERALDELSLQVSKLADTLSLEREKSAELGERITELSSQLKATLAERDSLTSRLAVTTQRAEVAETEASQLEAKLEDASTIIAADKEKIELQLREIASLQERIANLRQRRTELETRVTELAETVKQRDEETVAARDRSKALEADLAEVKEESRAHVALLNQQIAALREQLAKLSAALALEESKVEEQKLKIAELGQRLNVALARKVQELNRYRSEFFGRLREALGDHPDIRIVGDRFIFPSELLFPTASAILMPAGRRQLARLAETLKIVTSKIPSDIDWILRVDGHTDRRPIQTARFPSNWELSTARAVSVVNYLIAQGIAPVRLAATGFGEFHPLDDRISQEAYKRNRRIEIKLTQP